jgi:hypothetical protein
MQKKSYIKSGEGAVASYDWADIVSGEGYIDFFGFASTSTTGGTVSYHASTNATRSNPKGAGLPNTTYNFITSTFGRPARIGGTALIYLARGAQAGGSPSTVTLTTSVTIYKVSGGVDTSIGTVAAKTISLTAGTSEEMEPDVLLCTLTETSIKIGDYLKFAVTLATTGSNAYHSAFAFDPSNADYANYNGGSGITITLSNTQLKFSVPFIIDL